MIIAAWVAMLTTLCVSCCVAIDQELAPRFGRLAIWRLRDCHCRNDETLRTDYRLLFTSLQKDQHDKFIDPGYHFGRIQRQLTGLIRSHCPLVFTHTTSINFLI